jgi:KDO2-lipid IV(A) lauroyltransferase
MDLLLYWIAVAVLALLQALPLGAVAWLGRTVGGIVFWCDARHRRVAITNIGTCLGNGKTQQEIHAMARENFRRIGESYGCAVKTASLHPDELKRRLDIVGLEKLMRLNADGVLPSRIVAVGHFGNFELYASLVRWSKGYRPASTYRALHSERLNRLLRKIRAHSGCRFFERRTEGGALRAALREDGLLLGLLCDQHAPEHSVRLPFLGVECSTSTAPAIYSLRFKIPLHTAICFRVKSGYWRIEVGDEIPTHESGKPRAMADIMRDVNTAFETAIHRDPVNWLWVHNRWKLVQRKKKK